MMLLPQKADILIDVPYDLVNATEGNGRSGSEHQAEQENEETAVGDNEDTRRTSSASNSTNDAISRDGSRGEASSLHTRGGGLGRLLRQCFGIRSRSRPVPQYRLYREHIPRPRRRHHRTRYTNNRYSDSDYYRNRPRHRRIRHRSYEYSRPHRYRRDRYHSPSPRRRNDVLPAALKATIAPNYDAMGESELFDTLLAEERGMDPMLRDVDERRARGEDV